MAGYWPSFYIYACLCTKEKLRSINVPNMNEAKQAWSMKDLLYYGKSLLFSCGALIILSGYPITVSVHFAFFIQ